ncbi:unnamed protein product [Caenorhabditis bovis]|uniref:DUF281 domain-containing protein n=1 Tax=Caenorhabditis bovis TaxID=2654633 RepID=A0A8S1FEB4_9PELO|nr:unnamed protein product [Caenorhabditis bovis]
MLKLLLLLFIFSNPIISQDNPLTCYHCISRLDINIINKTERNALKTALFTRYNVPPTSDYCGVGGTDVMFTSSELQNCTNGDVCVKIISSAPMDSDQHLELVIRGCKSKLFKPGFELSEESNCSNDGTSCIAICDQPLCNSVYLPFPILAIFFKFFI